jgi:hypothetical protein
MSIDAGQTYGRSSSQPVYYQQHQRVEYQVQIGGDVGTVQIEPGPSAGDWQETTWFVRSMRHAFPHDVGPISYASIANAIWTTVSTDVYAALRPYLDDAWTTVDRPGPQCLIPDYRGTALHDVSCRILLGRRIGALGPNHPQTATSYSQLGARLCLHGDLAAARYWLAAATEIRERICGPDHPETAISLCQLGWLHQVAGDPGEAKECLERALRIRRTALGLMHIDTSSSYVELGICLSSMGDTASAVSCFEQALQIRNRVLGPSHPESRILSEWLASKVGRHAETEQFRKTRVNESRPFDKRVANGLVDCMVDLATASISRAVHRNGPVQSMLRPMVSAVDAISKRRLWFFVVFGGAGAIGQTRNVSQSLNAHVPLTTDQMLKLPLDIALSSFWMLTFGLLMGWVGCLLHMLMFFTANRTDRQFDRSRRLSVSTLAGTVVGCFVGYHVAPAGFFWHSMAVAIVGLVLGIVTGVGALIARSVFRSGRWLVMRVMSR